MFTKTVVPRSYVPGEVGCRTLETEGHAVVKTRWQKSQTKSIRGRVLQIRFVGCAEWKASLIRRACAPLIPVGAWPTRILACGAPAKPWATV